MSAAADVARDASGRPIKAGTLTPEQEREILKIAYEARLAAHVIRERLAEITAKGGPEMSERLLKNLEELMASIMENAPKLEERLGRSDPGALSAAKYHEALERLSRE